MQLVLGLLFSILLGFLFKYVTGTFRRHCVSIVLGGALVLYTFGAHSK